MTAPRDLRLQCRVCPFHTVATDYDPITEHVEDEHPDVDALPWDLYQIVHKSAAGERFHDPAAGDGPQRTLGELQPGGST